MGYPLSYLDNLLPFQRTFAWNLWRNACCSLPTFTKSSWLNGSRETSEPRNRHSTQPFFCHLHGCLTCPHIDNERTNYTFYITGEVREIKQQMTCKSTNPIFIIESCKRCTKQYMGENKSTLRERFTDHRQATNNPSHAKASAAVPTHFNLPDHSIEDMTLIPLELQPTLNTSRRKGRLIWYTEAKR